MILAAFVVVAVASARPSGVAAHASRPPCLVMTGSGDPAFTKNFNPYIATGLPSGQFVRGRCKRRHPTAADAPWLARTWKWSNGN